AEKPAVETAPRDPRQVLRTHSALGALYFLASLWLVFVGLPTLWRWLDMSNIFNEFLADSLLFLVTLPAIFGLILLGRNLEGEHPVHGQRAGAACLSFAAIVCGLLITCGVMLWTFIGIGLLVAAVVLFFQPGFADWLVQVEAQGWFHAVQYKANQGLRVRRGTVMGVMVLVICVVITMINHGMLRTGSHWWVYKPFGDTAATATNPWIVTLPFSDTSVVFMYAITLTIPVLCLIAGGWISWRLVNWPTFADFLIATEAEMNKVSWTTRKRLYQDTIVVLVTVVLMTVFLFLVDILWIKILTSEAIKVLQHDPQAALRKQQSGAQW